MNRHKVFAVLLTLWFGLSPLQVACDDGHSDFNSNTTYLFSADEVNRTAEIAKGHTMVKAEEALKQMLFKDNGYDKSVRPVGNHTSSTRVTLDFTLKQLLELNMRQEYIEFIAYVRFYWFDARLKWDAKRFGLERIRVMASKVFVPDIVIVNLAMDRDFFGYLPKDAIAIIKFDGSMYLSRPAVLRTTCPIEMTLFPYDVQECPIIFEAWAHTADLMDIYPRTDKANTRQYREHNEMRLRKAQASRVVKKSISGFWPGVTYTLVFQRRPLYFLSNFILPCTLIEFCTLLIFILPCESGEKISMGVSLILGLSVLLLVLQETMPVNSKVMPIVSLYFLKSIFLTVVNIFFTVLVLNIHYRADHGDRPPRWLRKLTVKLLSKLVCKRQIPKGFNASPTKANTRSSVNFSSHLTGERLASNETSLFLAHSHNGDALQESNTSDELVREHYTKEDHAKLLELKRISVLLDNMIRSNKQTTNDKLYKARASECHFVATVLDRLLFVIFTIASLIINFCLIMKIVDNEGLLIKHVHSD